MVEAIILKCMLAIGALAVAGVIFGLVGLRRCDVVMKHQLRIANALFRRAVAMHVPLDYDSIMESFDDTYKRWWDWSDKRILKDPALYEELKRCGWLKEGRRGA